MRKALIPLLMKSPRFKILTSFCLVLFAASVVHGEARFEDEGSLFMTPLVETRKKVFKNGQTVSAFNTRGNVSSQNPDSPWHEASFFGQGTIVNDGDGNRIAKVTLCEMIDADGDITWGVLWEPAEKSATYQIKAGTGKWNNIVGRGEFEQLDTERADGFVSSDWEITWSFSNGKPRDVDVDKKNYRYHDQGLSFHGPHIKESERMLANGVKLVISNQSGVLLSDDPAAKSPRNFATCFDRGTTVGNKERSALGDVMLLEDTDPDGDIVWLYHEWWYGKGPGSYEFIGGTGKWTGITGFGVTRGMLRGRVDDHYMLKSEMHWNLPSD